MKGRGERKAHTPKLSVSDTLKKNPMRDGHKQL